MRCRVLVLYSADLIFIILALQGCMEFAIPSVQGNIQGLKPGQTRALERLYKRRFPADRVCSPEQAHELALLSRAIGRQIGLLIDRKGRVQMVISGEAGSILIPELPPLAASSTRLRGWRLLHTHLSDEGLNQEDLLDMLFLRLDMALALTTGENGEPREIQAAWLAPAGWMRQAASQPWHIGQLRPWHESQLDLDAIIAEIEQGAPVRESAAAASGEEREKAILVSVSPLPAAIQEKNLDELQKLAETAGLACAGRLAQRIAQTNPRHILGKGKLAELEGLALSADAGALVFDGELSPAQLHNLADLTGRKVLDRTQIILDIFAQRATSRAGKLQVELAQLAYSQPRLAGREKIMDRLMGGIGGRGPGESRLETDRRRIRSRMAFLKKELERLRRQRGYARARRLRNNVPVVALAGYTNAGKSSLLNRMTASDVLAADQLFATLDPATRRLRFPAEREIVLADTIGFIRNLPAELRQAFQATLEELAQASLLLHVADAAHPDLRQQIESVEQTLEELGLQKLPRLLLLNKCDLLDADALERLLEAFPGALAVSAASGMGLEKALERIEKELFIRKTVGDLSQ